MRIPFAKMHGAGNDFVVINCLQADPVDDWETFARLALDRHFGVGGDQLLLVQPSREADFLMSIRNPDVTPRWLGDNQVEVEMNRPVLEPEKIPTTLRGPVPLIEVQLDVAGQNLLVTAISMGNPHCVLFVDDPERFPVEELGPALENHPAFPQRTNVEFVAVRSRDTLEQRTWERGTGETLACGSGACAAAVAAMLAEKANREVQVRLRGGVLRIRWPRDDGPVWLSGPAEHVFDGELEIP
jgi:diaminopimelate epimerase